MNQNELFYTLALMRTEGIGDISAKKLLAHFGSAENVFKTSKKELDKVFRVTQNSIDRIHNKTAFQAAEKEVTFLDKNNLHVYFFQDDNYPEKLKHCVDSPVLLFGAGNINLENRKILSIVGTRNITAYGTSFCKKFIEDLAILNPVIVSGFALGTDICAHLSALENNLQTVGVLAHGLNQIYPKSHKKYIKQLEENGGFLTEFWSDSNPDKENFVRRNRIVAGISDATIVIESAAKGGSLITANLANDYNREVFAVPGKTTDIYSQGCNNLIKTQRANLLTSVADLVYMLNWDIKTKKEKTIQKQLFVSLTDEQQKIYDYLLKNQKEQLDMIARDCNIPIYKAASVLLDMELKGVIRPLPGKQFELA
jgi:DNA processing protein